MENVFYGGKDPRDLPTYSLREVATYIRVPEATVGLWVKSPKHDGLVAPAQMKPRRTLSFWNLIELSVLTTIRRKEGLPLQRIRKALRRLRQEFNAPRPLIDQRFLHDGLNLFVETLGGVLNVSQLEFVEDEIGKRLKRVEWDAKSLAQRMFLLSRSGDDETNAIMIDPMRAFGKPSIVGTGIEVAAVVDRYMAGDTVTCIADDFGLDEQLVDEAIRCTLVAAA